MTSNTKNLSSKRIVFFGTPEFAVPFLSTLIKERFTVAAVVTQPDKKMGRKQKMISSPVKETALKNNIPVLEPKSLKKNTKFSQKLNEFKPDIVVVVAYGKIIPANILSVPTYGFINIHPSLLPKYRGPSPIQWALQNGDKKTGITIMQLDSGMDTGAILFQKKLIISTNDNAKTLHDKIAKEGSKLLVNKLPDILNQNVRPKKQNDSLATYSKLINRADGVIDFSKSATHIENQGRAFYPWPGLYTFLGKKRIKITLPKGYSSKKYAHSQGTFFITNSGECAILCSTGYIVPKALQIEGKRELSNNEFVLGYKSLLS
ncbi:methionyl-tRNA formyltransferase [Patescibacteria group bacterium]|nr:methionyl-tRNA formyltransferase [Patescibacteria group bacterium]